VVNHPKPFVSAATGSFCKSSKPGNFASFLTGSIGELPKPAYFPPWLGGRSAGRLAFAAPKPAKYLSSTFALPPGPLLGESVRAPKGVWLLLVAEVGVALLKLIEDGPGLADGT
jgi:hypothetical protein